jgi:hypothetical protein
LIADCDAVAAGDADAELVFAVVHVAGRRSMRKRNRQRLAVHAGRLRR